MVQGDAVIRAFGALAQEHRLAAYRLLVEAGREGIRAGDIADALGLPASSLSFHLSQLQAAGLVTQRRDGRSNIYAPDYSVMAQLIGYLTENCSRGKGCGEVPGCGPASPTCDAASAASNVSLPVPTHW